MSTPGGPRRRARRPGPRPRLSRDAIVEAATRVDPLTVGGVAGALGVSVGSLYRHVDGLDDLAAGAVAHLLATAPPPDADSGWRALLETEAALWVRLRREHGALFAVPAADTAVAAVARVDRVVRALAGRGVDVDDALLVVDSVGDLVRDGVRQARAVERSREAGEPPPSGLSAVVGAALQRVVDDPWAFLDRKLALLLDGVAARADVTGATTRVAHDRG